MELPSNFLQIALLSSLWVLPWKGLALWKAAKNNHKWWFIAILILNTLAIVEIFYLFAIPPRTKFSFSWNKKK